MKVFFAILVAVIAGPFSVLAAVLQDRVSDIIGYAALGETTGGAGGPTTRVSTLADFTSAVAGNAAKTVILTGNCVIRIGANTSVLGADSSITLNGIGLYVLDTSNVIIRNLKIQKVLASAGDAIGIQRSSRVWVDHVDLSSDRSHNKDYYDGLVDITHGSTCITVSWSKLSNHWKASLVGHSDDNCKQDRNITVTFHHNYWSNLHSRTPSFRCGKGHIFNNYFENSDLDIETRVGAQLQVENNVFFNVSKPIFSNDGYACLVGNQLGVRSDTVPWGNCFKPPYTYSLDANLSVKSIVTGYAGANLVFH